MDTQEYVYDIALSFAGEDREFVDEVALSLKEHGVSVFYDEFEKVNLWGKDLYNHLDWVYRLASRYCVVFISEHYARKMWSNHERSSAQARAIKENSEYVLPVKFDETDIDGVLPTIGYLDISELSPIELADHIREKVGPRPTRQNFPNTPVRLWEFMEIGEGDIERRETVYSIAYSFYRALERMNINERRAVCGLLAFGCPGELPEHVHISLDLLRRMTKFTKEELLSHLSAVRSLNVKILTRDSVHEFEPRELSPDDLDLTLNYWTSEEEETDESATEIAKHVIGLASDHYCEDHGLEFIVNLDFSRLGSLDDQVSA